MKTLRIISIILRCIIALFILLFSIATFMGKSYMQTLALFVPMGLTQLTNTSIFMLSAASMYPFQFVKNSVIKWAIGEDEYVNRKSSHLVAVEHAERINQEISNFLKLK